MNRKALSVGELEAASVSVSGQCEPAIVCAVLMPHAPILVPDVGGARGEAATASRRAMRAAAARVVRHQPQTVILISPHSPRKAGAFGIWTDDPLSGSLEQFQAPQVAVNLPNDPALARALVGEVRSRGLATWTVHSHSLDHGAVVPLWFLTEAGWTGPTLVLGLNAPHEGGLGELGQAIAAAARNQHRRVALIASGDMSHRLKEGAPCGFHPSAHRFDEMFMELLRTGSYQEIECMDANLRVLAAEDAADSTVIAASAVDWKTSGHEVLNYEGPFGVGYGVAVLFEEADSHTGSGLEPAQPAISDGRMLPRLARQAVMTGLSGPPAQPPSARGDYLSAQRGVFVTVRHQHGGLRGCVGTFLPVCPNVVAETWRSAQLAAFKDARFSPVAPAELAGLRFEVSVLYALEDVASAADLDPHRFGVVVSTRDGRRGLLLPHVSGIRTGPQQLSLACEKGWIDMNEPMTIQRFEVDHFAEAEPANP